VGAENQLDLAVIFVIPPFIKIAHAGHYFIVRSGNDVNIIEKWPLFWWWTGYMTLKVVSESPDYGINRITHRSTASHSSFRILFQLPIYPVSHRHPSPSEIIEEQRGYIETEKWNTQDKRDQTSTTWLRAVRIDRSNCPQF
jgi:hypothetical protein